MPLSFIEAIANEKSWDTLHSESPSARMRRLMFRGQTIWPKTAMDMGASKGLPGAVASNMEEWGFTFERIPATDGSGEKGFKLSNPSHVPVTRVKKFHQPQRGALDGERIVPKSPRISGEEKRGDRRGDLGKRIRQALIDGEALSSNEAMRKFNCSEGNLRRVVYRMKQEGFAFDEYSSPSGKTWAVKANKRGKAAQNGSNGNGKHGTELVPFGQHGSEISSLPPVPAFGSNVQVVGTYVDRSGVVSMVLRGDDVDWLTTVDSHQVEGESV